MRMMVVLEPPWGSSLNRGWDGRIAELVAVEAVGLGPEHLAMLAMVAEVHLDVVHTCARR